MATPVQGGHAEATLFSPCYHLDSIKSHAQCSASLDNCFFYDTLYPASPQCPPTTIHQKTHLQGMCGREGRWMSMRGVRHQGCTSRLSPSVCGSCAFQVPLMQLFQWTAPTLGSLPHLYGVVYCPLELYHLSLAALQCCGNLLFRNTHTLWGY